jgi:enterobactin synthetase component F
VLASGPGDGFNITWRGRADGSQLHVDIDAQAGMGGDMTPDEEVQSLIDYLCTASSPGATLHL